MVFIFDLLDPESALRWIRSVRGVERRVGGMLTTMAPYSPNEKTRVFLSVFPHPASDSSSDAYREHRRRSWRCGVSSEGTRAVRETCLIFLQRSEVSVRNRQPSFEKLSSPRDSITSIPYPHIPDP